MPLFPEDEPQFTYRNQPTEACASETRTLTTAGEFRENEEEEKGKREKDHREEERTIKIKRARRPDPAFFAGQGGEFDFRNSAQQSRFRPDTLLPALIAINHKSA